MPTEPAPKTNDSPAVASANLFGLEFGPRDHPEDAGGENGNYTNSCCRCNHDFIGHKRRYICKLCDAETIEQWRAMTDKERRAAVKATSEAIAVAFARSRKPND